MVFASQKSESSAPAGPTYRAFLLRCWQEAGAGPDGRAAWRFCLVAPGDGETARAFASLEALLAYLQAELNDEAHVTEKVSPRRTRAKKT